MRIGLAFAGVIVLLSFTSLSAGTLFPGPVIVVTPAKINFGTAARNHSLTNTFLVENAGSGKLVGKASVPPPFKILDGETYELKGNEAQIVTIIYTGGDSPVVTNTVKFTGGGGAKATVIGRSRKGS